VATEAQLSAFAAHSSISVHSVPSPLLFVYPAGHAHVNPPGVFVQIATGSQLSAFVVH
jgi:hypothetical protein